MYLKSISLLCTSALVFSCAPKDQKINRPFDTARSAQTTSANSTDAKADNYKYLALAVEKQVEVLQLFKVLTDSDFALKKGYKVEFAPEVNGVVSAKLVYKNELNANNKTITLKSSLNVNIQTNQDKTIQKITITENKADLSSQKILNTQDRSDLILKNKQTFIVIEKAELADTFNVTLDTMDESNSKQGKMLLLNTMGFSFTQVKDDPSSFKINAINLGHNRYGIQTADFSMKSDKINLTAQINDKCASLTGSLLLNSTELDKTKTKPLYTREFAFDDSSAVLKSGKDTIPLKAASCEQRSIVDLNKIF